MKTKWIATAIVGLALSVTAQAQDFEDDLYFDPSSAKTEKAENARKVKTQPVKTQKQQVNIYDNTNSLKVYERNVDEYNRRPGTGTSSQGVGNDTVSLDSAELDSNGQPFEYSERIRRFHDPKFTRHITDDEYLNIYVEDGADVNIYYSDGGYSPFMSPWYYDRYWYPSYGYGWNGWYRTRWSWYYDPWMYGGWGYCDPWYTGYYGYGFGSWYDPWWGYSGHYGYYGYYGDYYGYHGGYYHGGLGGDSFSRNRHTLSNNQRDFISGVGDRLPYNCRSTSGVRSDRTSISGGRGYSYSTVTTTRNNYNGGLSSTRQGGDNSVRSTYSTTRQGDMNSTRGMYSTTRQGSDNNTIRSTYGTTRQGTNNPASGYSTTRTTTTSQGSVRGYNNPTYYNTTSRSSTQTSVSEPASSSVRSGYSTTRTQTESSGQRSTYNNTRTSYQGNSQSYSEPTRSTSSFSGSSSSSSSSYSPSRSSSSSSSSSFGGGGGGSRATISGGGRR